MYWEKLNARGFNSRQLHCFAKASQCEHFMVLTTKCGHKKTWHKAAPSGRLCFCATKKEAVSPALLCEVASLRSTSVALCEAGPYNLRMYYVYIIQSQKDASYYTGVTRDLEKRLTQHNSGLPRYSSSKKPFKLIWYCAFPDKIKALDFETYLKQGSGYAFRNKHLI
jgi:putative endonuclease